MYFRGFKGGAINNPKRTGEWEYLGETGRLQCQNDPSIAYIWDGAVLLPAEVHCIILSLRCANSFDIREPLHLVVGDGATQQFVLSAILTI
jgi:hypothetical protein